MSLDQAEAIVKHQTVTRDAFLGGRLHVSQPGNGFRAGVDSVLLGASVPDGAKTLLDLGAGVGTAGLVALADHSVLDATLAERDEEALALARANIASNGFAARARALCVDVTATGKLREAAGVARDFYETVIANPPFFIAGSGTPAAGARAGARHMERADLTLWIKAAAAAAAPDGLAIFILPAESLPLALAGFEGRFGAIEVLPLLVRPGQPALRVLIRGRKGSRAPFRLLAGRPLHAENGKAFMPEIDAVFRGHGRFHW